MTSKTSKIEVSVTIGNKFHPLTNFKKNSNFLCGGDSRFTSLDTAKLGKTQKYGQFPSKNFKKVRF